MATAATATWDLRVVSAFNAASVVGYVPRWTSIEFSDQLSEVGSGRIIHDFNDPWFDYFESQNGQSLLTGPYALQIMRNSTPVFTFLIEDIQVDRAGATQPMTISGRGIGAALEWAIVLPENFTGAARVGTTTSVTPKYFDRLFPGYHNVVRCATTANLSASYSNGYSASLPGVGAKLTASSNGNINSSGIDGITDLTVGDNILVKNQTNSAHNGVYWLASTGSASTPWVIQRVATHDGSPVADLTSGRRIFVQEGANGYVAYSLTPASTITSPTQVGSVGLSYGLISSATGTFTGIGAFYCLFKEAHTGYEYVTTDNGSWAQQNTSAGRGTTLAVTTPLSLDSTLSTNLGKTDSKSKIVQDGGFFTVPVGKTLLEVLKQITDQTKTDWHVSATGEISIVVKPFTRNGVNNTTPYGTDRTSGATAKLFTLPMLASAETKTSSSALRTVVYGSDARQLDRLISPSVSSYGIREAYFENTSDDAPAVSNITNSGLRTVEGGKIQITTTFSERDGFIAWQDFGIGDKVLVEIEVGVYSQRIISAISAAISSTNEPTVEITFGDVFPDVAENLTSAAGFGSLNASELATFSGQPANVYLQAPTSTSIVASVNGMSNRATISWDSADAGRVSQYEVAVYREEEQLVGSAYQKIKRFASGIARNSNVAVVTFPSAHGYSTGNLVNIDCATDDTFSGFSVPILSVISSVSFAYSNLGIDKTITSASVATVTKVVELTTSVVDGSKDAASVENLAAPGRNYSAMITPYNEYGIAGDSSTPLAFTASTSPFQLLDASIQSSNYAVGTTGWKIAADGSAEFNGGSFSVTSIDIGGADTTSFHVDTSGNMWMGNAAYASAPFRVSSGGALRAQSGDIAGWTIVGNNLESGAGYVGSMAMGPTAYTGEPAYTVEYTNGRISRLFGGNLELYHQNGGFISAVAQNNEITASNGTISSSMDAGGVYTTTVATNILNASSTAGIYMNTGIGFSFQGVTAGPGNHNFMALDWTGSNAFAVIDNSGIEYLNDSLSDRRIKRNIAEPEEYWVDKLLNSVKIWQFNKINPFNDWDEHVYPLQLGVIADEFKTVFPQWESSNLMRDPDGEDAEKIRSVHYAALIPPLVLTVQKLNERIKVLENRLGI